MSFILDALKKSEVERQRQAIPGLMDSRPLPPRSRLPVWAAALIALLAVNLGILAVVLMRGGLHIGAADDRLAAARPTAPPPATASAPTTAPLPATASAPAAASRAAAVPPSATAAAPATAALAPSDHFSPMDAAPPVYAPEVPPTPDVSPPAERRTAREGSISGRTSRHTAHAEDPLLTDRADRTDSTDRTDPSDNEVLPSINEIDLTNQPALANLHLDVHVFATRPADRFVYINMRKYREGSTLAEGPVLERIRRDGVVLNYQGLRFVLPRQQ